MGFLEELKNKVVKTTAFKKIILLNIILFFTALLLGVAMQNESSLSLLELPSNLNQFIQQPWSIFTYAFVHYRLLHLLINLIILYYLGSIFTNLLSDTLGVQVYIMGILAGGIIFLLAYLLFPVYFSTNHRLIGASAAIRALLFFLCFYIPQQEVRFFTITIKLQYIAIGILIIDILGVVAVENRGGNVAHLGGALMGFIYAKQLLKGNDIGKWITQLTNKIRSIFGTKKKPLKTSYKRNSKIAGYTKEEFKAYNKQKQIDLILDKISKSGYESLTKEEKDFLFTAGK